MPLIAAPVVREGSTANAQSLASLPGLFDNLRRCCIYIRLPPTPGHSLQGSHAGNPSVVLAD